MPVPDTHETSRRTVLRSGALVAGGLLGSGLLTGRARAGDAVDLTEWLAETDGADEVVDWRGAGSATITVGAEGNSGAFAFGPAVARVDPGTTVTWEWTGEGGSHNVADVDGAFASEFFTEAGATFEYVADAEGVYRYECEPHSPMGMRGVLVVGDAEVILPSDAEPSSEDAETDEAGDTPTEEADLGPRRDFDGWLDDTDNYRGVADRRGESEVTIQVGAAGNGGPFAFEPAAIHVDPGTTVVWEWVSDAAAYDVVDETIDFASDQVKATGHVFALRFDGDGESRYTCTKYGDQGMRGVVVVGDGPGRMLTTAGTLGAVGVAGVAVTPMALGLRYHFQNVSDGRRVENAGADEERVDDTRPDEQA